jgi:SH3 domain protein
MLTLLAAPSAWAAESAYVTDHLQLGMFADSNASGKRIATLESGDRVQILERARRYAKVRAPDGRIGWVKAAFLVDKPPAVVRIDKLEQDNERLTQALAEARERLAEPQAIAEREKAALKRALEDANRRLQQAEHTVVQLSDELEQTRAELALYRPQEAGIDPRWWILLGGIGLFTGGFWWGKRVIDNRMRRRLSGFRLG